MSGMRPFQTIGLVLEEMQATLAGMRAEQVGALEEAILGSGSVFATGEGRSGLVARCLAMRLMHLGIDSHVVGETVTPSLQAGDLLVAVSGSGETPVTCWLASAAANQGGRVAAVTATLSSTLAASAEVSVVVPARTSAQFGGSLFEQSALLVLDAIAFDLQRRLGVTTEQMQARHATLE